MMAQVSANTQQVPAGNAFGMNPVPDVSTDYQQEVDQVVEDTTAEASNDAAPTPQVVDTQAEEEARRHGWVPKEEWRGAPERWRPASEFLDVRNNILRIARDETSQVRAELAAVKAKLAERDRRDAEARETITLNSLESEIEAAAESGDTKRVTQLTRQLIDTKVKAATTPKPADPVAQETNQQWSSWAAQNTWLQRDPELAHNFAIEVRNVHAVNPTIDMNAGLNLAKQRVMRLFPDRFRNGSRPAPASMVDMGGTPGGTTNGRSWNDLLPSVRRVADEEVRQKKYTREEFLANCDDEHFRR